jgi:hypothetical protein
MMAMFGMVFERHGKAVPQGSEAAPRCVSPPVHPQPAPAPCNTVAVGRPADTEVTAFTDGAPRPSIDSLGWVVDSNWPQNIEAGALKAVNGGLLSAIRKEADHSGVKAQKHPEQAAELRRLVDAMQQWIEEERQNGRPEYELQRLTVRDFFAHLRSRRAAGRRPKQPHGE